MESLIALGLGSLKALLLLVLASGIALALRGRPARLRAVIWATALVGSLLIPLVSMVVPVLSVELPVELPRLTTESRPAAAPDIRGVIPTGAPIPKSDSAGDPLPVNEPARSWSMPTPETIIASIWGMVALLLLARQGAGLLQMKRIIARARPVARPSWLVLFDDVRRQIGCHRNIDMVITSEIEIPAVFGLIRPVVILPQQAQVWLPDRLEAVLQHETVHIVRFDWPLRIAARVARSIYWFNPLAWWAARRLDLEQEMACDEEVLSLGSRASSYACHLLGIARTAVPSPAVASAGLSMARRSHLEERIMRILKRSKHRRVGFAVILPAVLLTAALVPALASVQPAEPAGTPRIVDPAEPTEPAKPTKPARPAQPASPELKAAIAEMEEAETRIEPYLDRISDVEIDMQPVIERIEAIDIDIDHEAIARIEAEMAPILAQIEDIEIDMEPVHEQMERMHTEMERIHKEMEPFQEEMERMGARIEGALISDVSDVLRSHLGPVSPLNAPYREAAARIIDEGNIHIHNDLVELNASSIEVREILSDLFSNGRIGTQDAFDAALDDAVDEVSDLRIQVE